MSLQDLFCQRCMSLISRNLAQSLSLTIYRMQPLLCKCVMKFARNKTLQTSIFCYSSISFHDCSIRRCWNYEKQALNVILSHVYPASEQCGGSVWGARRTTRTEQVYQSLYLFSARQDWYFLTYLRRQPFRRWRITIKTRSSLLSPD